MAKNLIALVLLSAGFFHWASLVHAQDFSVGINPQMTFIKAVKPGVLSSDIEIENFSDQPVDLAISFREFEADPDTNGLRFGESNTQFQSFIKQIAVLDGEEKITSLTLSGKQKKELALEVTIPDDFEAGDQALSVLFIRTAPELPSKSNENLAITHINPGTATNLIVSVGKRQPADLKITSFNTPAFLEKSPIPFVIEVENRSKQVSRVTSTLTISNMFGQRIGRIEIPTTTILATSSRRLSSSDSQSMQTINAGNTMDNVTGVVLWDERFLLGKYTATVVVNPDNGPPETTTTTFYVLPIRIFLVVLGLISLLVLIIARTRKKLRQ